MTAEWTGLAATRRAALLVLAAAVLLAAGGTAYWHYRRLSAAAVRSAADTELGLAAERSAGLLERRLLRYEALHSLASVIATARNPPGESGGVATALRELKANLALDRSEVAYVTGMDAQGIVQWSTEPVVPGTIDLSGEEHVRAIISGAARAAVGAPRSGRVADRYAFRLTQGVYRENGTLAGIVTLSLDPGQLARLILPASPRDGPFSVVLRNDGLLLGSSRAGIAALEVPPALRAAALRGGTALGRTGMGAGAGYRVALHRADPFGLIAVVGRDEAGVDADAAAALHRYDIEALGIAAIALFALALAAAALAARRRAGIERRSRLEAEAGMTKVRQVTDSLQDMIILWEETGANERRFTFVSPSCQAMLGVPAAEVIAQPGLYRYHPDDVPAVRARLARLRAGEKVPPAEVRVLRPDGEVVWVEAASERVPAGPGAAATRRYVTCLHDITARKASEAALRDATRRLESLTDNSPGMLYEMELEELPDGRLRAIPLYSSTGLSRMTGYSQEELAARGSFARNTEPGAVTARQAAHRRALAEGHASYECVFRTKAGGRITLRDKFTLVRRTPRGGIIVGFASDVTEEDALRRQLAEAAKLSFLGEMAAGIAHELHQPLTAITLQAESLSLMVPEDSPARPVVVRQTDRIAALCDRAASVIRRVSAFSRRNTDAAAPFDPAAAIADAIALLQSRLGNTAVSVTPDGDGPAPLVMGHEGPFTQVVVNLIGNAIDAYDMTARPPGAPRDVAISVTADDGRVIVTVTDHAGGIAADVLPRIFEPFYTTKPQGKGTGLGLSISHRIVEDMGGRLAAANEAGGCRFTITLPAAGRAGRGG